MKKPIAMKGKQAKKLTNKVHMKAKKPTRNVGAKPKKSADYSDMSIDDFIEKEIDRSSEEENEDTPENSSAAEMSEEESPNTNEEEAEISEDAKISDDAENSDDAEINEDSGEDSPNVSAEESEMKRETKEEDEDSEAEDEDSNEFESHKESLAKLKQIDPEFYKFLEENDQKLLNFKGDDSDDDETEDDDVDKLHKPEGDLEVASDESDFEPDEEKSGDGRTLTLKILKKWQQDIQTDTTAKTIYCLMKAFHAALVRVSNEEEYAEYKIDGSSVFNAVIQLCVLELGPALRRFLHLPNGSRMAPQKRKRFVKVKALILGYFDDLLKLLGGVTSTNILNVLLKHLHYMCPFMVAYTGLTKKMLKRMIHLWGTADETVRIVSFMCILRITNDQQSSYLDMVLKSMYMTYVKNCKFMAQSQLAEINFMRRSLTEMFALDINVSYQHVFLYIRQLAIHLRSAYMLHKKENIQAVYNWQFINSLHLWASLLTITCNKTQLQPLIYPLVQVAIGTIKLLPIAQYFPLRFHCIQILMDLSRDTNVFIPILPLLLETLTIYDINKKHKKVSMKPIQFTCLLRLSKSQMEENAFKDATIDNVYGLLLEYLANQSYMISFPDNTLFAVIQIKQFLKKCTVANYTRKFRQILEKIDQNSKFIETERRKVTFNITDLKQIDAWETQIRNKGTPIMTFFESWSKISNIKKRKQVTNNEELGDYALPILKKHTKSIVAKSTGPVDLFPSDSDSEGGVVQEVKAPGNKKRGKRGSKINKNKALMDDQETVEDAHAQDIIEDMKASDW